MFNRNIVIVMTMLFVLLAATPAIMARDSGSAKFNVVSKLYVMGQEVEKGRYNISWKAVGENATVTIVPVGKKEGITVTGVIEKVQDKNDYNNLAIGRDDNGNRAIKQLQFKGQKFRIVFK